MFHITILTLSVSLCVFLSCSLFLSFSLSLPLSFSLPLPLFVQSGNEWLTADPTDPTDTNGTNGTNVSIDGPTVDALGETSLSGAAAEAFLEGRRGASIHHNGTNGTGGGSEGESKGGGGEGGGGGGKMGDSSDDETVEGEGRIY
jgi:hypothetical protein